MAAALISTASVFYFHDQFHQVFWMVPIMGFCILSLFAGYAIYFPELFPTHLRSTGTSFCYNVGRFVAAVGPALLGWLTGVVYADTAEPLRNAGLTMCGVFVLGLIVLIRTFLSFSLQIEIEGVPPWRRATASGAGVMGRAAARAQEAQRAGTES